MIKAVDIIIIVLGLLVVGSAFLGRNEKSEDAYSSQTMNCIKGIFAIMIVLFHLSQHINGGTLFIAIGDTGYLSVAVFYFISGYGMYTRILQTGGGYCKGFITHRIPRILLPWLISSLIYALYYLIEGGFVRIIQICNNRENGYLLITNSWFVIAIAAFYLIFFLAFKWCDGDFRRGIRRSLLGVFLFMVLEYFSGLGSWWFYSSLAFVLGMIWKENEAKINRITEKKWILFLIIWGGVFAVSYAIRFLNSKTIHSTVVYDSALLIASAAFTGIVFTLLKKITVNNGMWSLLGGISFEIYLLHELVYNILRNEKLGIYVGNDLLYIVLVILISVGCAYVFNIVITKKLISKMLR